MSQEAAPQVQNDAQAVQEAGDDVQATLDMVKGFLLVGRLTWTDWQGMDAATRAYFVEAAEQMEAERLALMGAVMSDPNAPAQVYARVDGGDALVHRALTQAVSRLVERTR